MTTSISDADRKGIARALAESTSSTFGRVKIGAYITTARGHSKGVGHNSRKTHPRQYAANLRTGRQIERPCLHAEMSAILCMESEHDIQWLSPEPPHTIYVARLARSGNWANCRPCAACASEIVAAGIKRVVYTTENGVEEYECP